MSNTLQTAGGGWEFLNLPKSEYPHIGRGRAWNPITGCPRLAAGKPCSTPPREIKWKEEIVLSDNMPRVLDIEKPKPYCYMGALIKRFPDVHKAEYRFHPDRLKQPENTKKPSIVAVGTAGDIPGYMENQFISDDHRMSAVFERIEKSQKHFYLFLTKNPAKYYYILEDLYFDFTDGNLGFGVTVTCPEDLYEINSFRELKAHVTMKWLCIEPCFFTLDEVQSLPSNTFIGINWVIIGAMTGPGSKHWRPKPQVINLLTEKAQKAGCAVYHKKSLKKIIGEENILREHPRQILEWAEAMR